MVNFNVEGLEGLRDFGDGALGGFMATFGVLAVFFIILLAIAVVFLWVFGSIGLMNLGFETYGDKKNQYNTTFMWITFGLGAASFLLGDGKGDLHQLINYGLLFFECWALYNMFKNLKPSKAVVYTVFSALTGTLLGGLFLYLLKPEDEVKEATVVEEKKEEEPKKAETKKETSKTKYCSECGTKLAADAKFCPECGKKVK